MPALTHTYRFGPYEIHTRTREIYKFGTRLKLRPQPFRVLEVLLERSGEVITREELRQMLWPADTFVDFEHGLNTSVKELRQALGDSAGNPRYIETVPRLGYRMIVPVEAEGLVSSPPISGHEATLPETTVAGRRTSTWWRRVALYAVLIVIAAVAGLLAVTWRRQPENSIPVPLTAFAGNERHPAWSPDGRQVAFVWNGDDQRDYHVYLMQPGSTRIVRLTGEPGDDDAPAWSPDGLSIAYHHISADGESLKLISPLGGPARTILTTGKRGMGSSSWMPDGHVMVTELVPEPHQPASLWAVWIDTGGRRQLTWPPAGIEGDTTPAVSPESRAVAFCRATGWRTSELYVLELQADLRPQGAPRRLTDLGYVGRPAWTPDGERILFEGPSGGAGIWQIDRNGARPKPIFGVGENAGEPALIKRPGGYTSMAFSNSFGGMAIWRYQQSSTAAPSELLLSSRSQRYASYSPDGKKLAFTSDRSGNEEIWVANADGSQPVQLTNLRHLLTEQADWSPAGNELAFISQDREERQLYAINSTGGVPVALTKERGVRVGGGWTRDGEGYYYTSTQSGRSEVLRVPRGGGRPQQMTAEGGQCGFESASGSFYYWGLGDEKRAPLMRRSPVGDRPVLLAPQGRACKTAFSRIGFYYKSAEAKDIYLYNEASGSSIRVFPRPELSFNAFAVSPDGRWLLIDSPRSENMDLMIMERFR